MAAQRQNARRWHRRILFLTHSGRHTIARRLEGWHDRMGGHDPALVVEVAGWVPALAAEALAARIRSGGADFTAVLCAGDSLAFGVLTALGLRVPQDMSVMGMDGLAQGALTTPPLTAIEMRCSISARRRWTCCAICRPAARCPRGSCGPMPTAPVSAAPGR